MIIDLDASAGTADIIEDYPLDRTCQNQGSMFSRSDGSRVMACVDGRVVYEFERGGSEPVWTLWSGCGGPMFRAVPIDLPDNLDHLLQR